MSSLFLFWLCSFFLEDRNYFFSSIFFRNNDFPKVVVILFFGLFFFVFGFALFFWRTGNPFFLALLVFIDHSHSISRHKPSQNMCGFVASLQAFVAKAVIACDHWCPYIVRHRANTCMETRL